MTPVRLEPAAPRSGVKHSTTALPACLNGDEHDFKKIMELPDCVNASKRFFQT